LIVGQNQTDYLSLFTLQMITLINPRTSKADVDIIKSSSGICLYCNGMQGVVKWQRKSS
jgi:hypothetical protein